MSTFLMSPEDTVDNEEQTPEPLPEQPNGKDSDGMLEALEALKASDVKINLVDDQGSQEGSEHSTFHESPIPEGQVHADISEYFELLDYINGSLDVEFPSLDDVNGDVDMIRKAKLIMDSDFITNAQSFKSQAIRGSSLMATTYKDIVEMTSDGELKGLEKVSSVDAMSIRLYYRSKKNTQTMRQQEEEWTSYWKTLTGSSESPVLINHQWMAGQVLSILKGGSVMVARYFPGSTIDEDGNFDHQFFTFFCEPMDEDKYWTCVAMIKFVEKSRKLIDYLETLYDSHGDYDSGLANSYYSFLALRLQHDIFVSMEERCSEMLKNWYELELWYRPKPLDMMEGTLADGDEAFAKYHNNGRNMLRNPADFNSITDMVTEDLNVNRPEPMEDFTLEARKTAQTRVAEYYQKIKVHRFWKTVTLGTENVTNDQETGDESDSDDDSEDGELNGASSVVSDATSGMSLQFQFNPHMMDEYGELMQQDEEQQKNYKFDPSTMLNADVMALLNNALDGTGLQMQDPMTALNTPLEGDSAYGGGETAQLVSLDTSLIDITQAREIYHNSDGKIKSKYATYLLSAKTVQNTVEVMKSALNKEISQNHRQAQVNAGVGKITELLEKVQVSLKNSFREYGEFVDKEVTDLTDALTIINWHDAVLSSIGKTGTEIKDLSKMVGYKFRDETDKPVSVPVVTDKSLQALSHSYGISCTINGRWYVTKMVWDETRANYLDNKSFGRERHEWIPQEIEQLENQKKYYREQMIENEAREMRKEIEAMERKTARANKKAKGKHSGLPSNTAAESDMMFRFKSMAKSVNVLNETTTSAGSGQPATASGGINDADFIKDLRKQTLEVKGERLTMETMIKQRNDHAIRADQAGRSVRAMDDPGTTNKNLLAIAGSDMSYFPLNVEESYTEKAARYAKAVALHRFSDGAEIRRNRNKDVETYKEYMEASGYITWYDQNKAHWENEEIHKNQSKQMKKMQRQMARGRGARPKSHY